VRLATWNILHGRSLDDGLVDEVRLRAAIAGLDADVLGVQEVDRGQSRSGGLDLAASVAAGAGARHWRFLAALRGTVDGQWRVPVDADDTSAEPAYGSEEPAYGIALMSRHPVRSWHTLRLAPLPSPPMSGRLPWPHDEPRVALAAVVETPLGVMTVASTHLSVVRGWSAVQLRMVSRWLRSLPEPQVVLGDLNMSARAAGVASGLRLLARHPTHPSPAPRVQLDHVLVRGVLPPVQASAAPRLSVSDHRPIVVQL